MSVRNPVVLHNATKLQFSDIPVGTKDFRIEMDVDLSEWTNNGFYSVSIFGQRFTEGLYIGLHLPPRNKDMSIMWFEAFSVYTEGLVHGYSPYGRQTIIIQADRDSNIFMNGSSVFSIATYSTDSFTLPVVYNNDGPNTIVYHSFKIYVDTLEADESKLQFDLQWDGVGMPWNAVNGERATLVSGDISPLYPITRVENQTGPGYKLSSGSKISFSSAPAGTLQVTKRENGVISTAESSFAGGTLELTDPDLLDAKIVDGNGDTLFQLGDMVGDSVFDYKGGLVGTVSGNVYPVVKKAVWALEFDGTGYVDCGNGGSLVITNGVISIITTVQLMKPLGGYIEILDTCNSQYRFGFEGVYFRMVLGGNEAPYLSYTEFLYGHHVLIGSANGNTKKLYLDGEFKGQGGISVGTPSGYTLKIGAHCAYPSLERFNGLIALPTIIYARAITDTEQKLLTQRRFDEVSRQDCVLWLDYDPDFYASTGKLKDFSGYGNHGTLVGNITIRKVML